MKIGLVALLIVGPALPVAANPFCDLLTAMSVSGEHALQEATCSTSLGLSGHRDMNCYWSFPYRSAQALAKFEKVSEDLAACLGPNATASRDQSVNHPDAYDLRLYSLDGAEYAVSLKDKGALQQTLVFVRVPDLTSE